MMGIALETRSESRRHPGTGMVTIGSRTKKRRPPEGDRRRVRGVGQDYGAVTTTSSM